MPNRVIKDSIKRSPQIDSLTWFEEVLFYRLIVTVDDYGCTDGRTIVVRSDLFPTKDNITKKAIEDALDRLEAVRLIVRYKVDGVDYIYLPSFEKHQRVRNKRRKYPLPPAEILENACQTNDGQMSASCLPESNPIQSVSESKTELEGEEGDARARETDFGTVEVDPLIVKVQTELNGLTDNHYFSLADYRQSLSDEVVSHAIDEAVANGVRNWSYVEAILRKYEGFGVHNIGEAKAVDEERRRQKDSKGVKTAVINPFLEALQRGDFSDAG